MTNALLISLIDLDNEYVGFSLVFPLKKGYRTYEEAILEIEDFEGRITKAFEDEYSYRGVLQTVVTQVRVEPSEGVYISSVDYFDDDSSDNVEREDLLCISFTRIDER